MVARVSSSGDFKMSSGDKVVVVPLAWSSVDQAVCVSKLNGCYVRFDGISFHPAICTSIMLVFNSFYFRA